MNSRRSFFKTLASVVAAVAIAPEIAFRRRLELPKAEPAGVPFSEFMYVGYTKVEGGDWKRTYIPEKELSKTVGDQRIFLLKFDPAVTGPAIEAILLQSPAPPSACSPSSTTRS